MAKPILSKDVLDPSDDIPMRVKKDMIKQLAKEISNYIHWSSVNRLDLGTTEVALSVKSFHIKCSIPYEPPF